MTVTEQQIQARHAQEEVRHKEQVIATLGVHSEMSDAEIGAHVGCSRQFVNRMRRQLGIETPTKLREEKPIDPHDALYNAIRAPITERHILYEDVSRHVLDDLHTFTIHHYSHHAQSLEDALSMTCVAMGRPPLETLLLVHEFLRNYVSILEHSNREKES
jgi:hypothetical protein